MVGVARGLSHLALGEQAAGARDRGDAAGKVDGPAKPVPGARNCGPERDTGAKLGKLLALGVCRVDQVKRHVEQRLGLGRCEHRGVADRLDEPHRRLGGLRCEHFQAHSQPPELVGRNFLAEAREADQVGEAHRHVPRSGQPTAAALDRADHLALRGVPKVQSQDVAQHRVDQRVELGGGLGIAAGELALAHAGLEDQFQREGPQAFGGLGKAAAEHAQ